MLHVWSEGRSILPEILNKSGPLAAEHGSDGDPLEYGWIHVAPPDFHMMVRNGHIELTHGPKENRHRPAIDPLFRSADFYYGPRGLGVILTGTLSDGAAGLMAVKRRGGVALVQDPADAEYGGDAGERNQVHAGRLHFSAGRNPQENHLTRRAGYGRGGCFSI